MLSEFDTPIFKVLARNDTGDAPGHQGGFVVPKDLEHYWPLLKKRTSPLNPTVDQLITADLFAGSIYLETVETRYQYQTWGGERSPERRVTGNITSLRNSAKEDDILLIERGVVDENHYRFTLISKDNPQYNNMIMQFDGKRWGVFNAAIPPVSEEETEQALIDIAQQEESGFQIFDSEAGILESRSRRIARSRAFQRRVRTIYGSDCVICNSGLVHPNGAMETEAAHIVPRSLKGSDDLRNGLLLCKTHHWAFDSGLIGIDDMFCTIVPPAVRDIPANKPLSDIQGQKIRLPKRADHFPSIEAIRWHRSNLLLI